MDTIVPYQEIYILYKEVKIMPWLSLSHLQLSQSGSDGRSKSWSISFGSSNATYSCTRYTVSLW